MVLKTFQYQTTEHLHFFLMDLSEAPSHTNLVSANGMISHASEILCIIKFQELSVRNMGIYSNYKSCASEDLAENTYIHTFSNLLKLLAPKDARVQ